MKKGSGGNGSFRRTGRKRMFNSIRRFLKKVKVRFHLSLKITFN